MREVKLGCSGWSYDNWVGPFYKSKGRKLFQHSQVFDIVEVDSTFYAYPQKGTVFGWLRNSRRELTFTAKLPKVITHEKLLSPKLGVEEDLKGFLDLMRPVQLEGRLGCLHLKRAKKILETLRRRKVVNQVGYHWRFLEGNVRAREVLLSEGGP